MRRSHLVVINGVDADGKTLLGRHAQRREKIEYLLLHQDAGRIESCITTTAATMWFSQQEARVRGLAPGGWMGLDPLEICK